MKHDNDRLRRRPILEVIEQRVLCAAGYAISPTSGLVTTEAGGRATYTVALTQAPTTNVTIPVASSNLSAGSVSPSSLTFTPTNWGTPQVVTATGVDDHLDDGNISFKVVNQAATSADPAYNRLDPADVSITNLNIDASSVARLRVMSPSAVGTADLLGYSAPGDGGGGTFLWNAASTAADNGGIVVAPAGTPASTPGRWIRQYSGAIDVRWFGAKGDGTTDDTAALQGALNAAAGGTVAAAPGATYLVSFAGNKTVVQSAGQYFQRYCLSVASGTTFNLQGSTLRLAAGQNASIVINQDPNYASAADTGITVENGILDSNQANQTAPGSGCMASAYFSNCTGLNTTNLTFNNVRDLAMFWQGVSNSTADQLLCTYSDGDGFDFGFYSPSAAYDGRVKSSTIGSVEADNCQNGLFVGGGVTRQGVPVVITATNTTFGSITANNDASAIRIVDGSSMDTITKAIFNAATGSSRTATNWMVVGGVRLQGNGVGHDPQNVAIGEVDSSNCSGQGLYLENTENCTVSVYKGVSNAQSGNNPDVWLGTGTGDSLGTVQSTGATGEGLLVRPAAAHFAVTTAIVANPSQAAWGQPAVEVEGTSGTIHEVVAGDSTGKMRYALEVLSSTTSATVGGVVSAGATDAAVRNQSAGVSVETVFTAPAQASSGAIIRAAVTPTSGLATTESGGTATFQVILIQPPAANVTVPVASLNTLAGKASPAALTFTPSNWYSPQTVTITGVDNTGSDRDTAYTVSVGPLAGSDPNFAGVTLPAVSLTDRNIDAFVLADLRSISPTATTSVTVPCYSSPGDGGGGTFLWSATSTVADNGGTVLAPAGTPASTPGRWIRQYSGAVDVRWFGAKGDGTTDDTAALQGALNAAAATAGGGTVAAVSGATYLVSFAGNKTVVQNAGQYFQRYCLSIGSGTTLNLNGATLRLAPRSDASILINQDPNPANAPDSRITVTNGTLDSDEADQSLPGSGCMSGIYFSNATGVAVTNITFARELDLAMSWVGVSSSTAANIVCTSSEGDGFFFGCFSPTSTWDTRVKNSSFNSIIAENCQNGLVMAGSVVRQGNPVLMNATNCTFSYIEADNCGGGIKITDGSSQVTITKAVFNGAVGSSRTSSNATNNSGLKIQGNGVGYDPQQITVGEVDASNCIGSGLYVQNATNSTVTTYIGVANGQNASNPDVWLGTASGITVRNIQSTGAFAEAVLVRSDDSNFNLGTATIVNAGQVATGQAGVELEGTNGTVNAIVASDSTGRMRYGLAVYYATASATIKSVQATGMTDAPVRQQSPGVVLTTVISDSSSPQSGTISPAAGAARIVVANTNVWKLPETGGSLCPIIHVVAQNAAGIALGTPTITLNPINTPGFVVSFAGAATGTEVFSWYISQWMYIPQNG